MGIFSSVGVMFKRDANKADECASGHPDWEPSASWTPEFEDELIPEVYDGN